MYKARITCGVSKFAWTLLNFDQPHHMYMCYKLKMIRHSFQHLFFALQWPVCIIVCATMYMYMYCICTRYTCTELYLYTLTSSSQHLFVC